MVIKFAIVEDEQCEREQFNAVVSEWAVKRNAAANITEFISAESFLFEHEDNNIYDILLLDIEMGDISGISLAKQIRRNDKRAEIIFITSHTEFIGEGYEVDALHYLIKPVRTDKLFSVLDKAAVNLAAESRSVIVTSEGELKKISEDDIIYIESFSHYITIHMSKEDITVKESISAFGEKLSERFYKTHRSYIVSLTRIVRISRTEITLDNGHKVPLSRGLYDSVNRAFIEHN